MNSILRTAHAEWPEEEQRRLLDDGHSHGSSSPSSPPLVEHPAPAAAPKSFPGSPRRNGVILNADVRSMFGMKAPHELRGLNRSPRGYQSLLSPTGMTQTSDEMMQRPIPPSLSGLSLQSACSGTSWKSQSSTSSRKHSLELPLDGSPRPKRRFVAEILGATADFRSSAPCTQGPVDGRGRREGFLRRSGAPIQAIFSLAADHNGPVPSIAAYAASGREVEAEAGGFALVLPSNPGPGPSRRANITSAPLEKQDVRERKGYSFWRLASPPFAMEAAVPERTQNEEGDCPPWFRTGGHPGQEPPSDVSSETAGGKGAARPRVLHTTGDPCGDEGASRGGGSVKICEPGEQNPVTMCGSRLYSDWEGYWNGVLRKIPGVGALFPEGYLPRVGSPEPWVCPVRDCQTIFADAWALGGHFSASHRASLLNDNLDGTMSVVGKRETADPGSGRMPPIVISRNAIDAATAPPKANPRRPRRRKKAEDVEQSEAFDLNEQSWLRGPGSSSLIPFGSVTNKRRPDISEDSSATGTSSSVRPLSQPTSEEARKSPLWQYLMVYLPANTPLANSPLARQLLHLARKRELSHRWKFQLAGGHPTTRTLCVVLVYLSGIKASSPCGVCASNGGPEAGNEQAALTVLPFPECIRLPDGASAELQEYFGPTTCCNRFYQPASAGEKRPYCVSRFSLSSSDLGVVNSVAEDVTNETAASSHAEDDGNDSKNDSESDSEDNGSPTRPTFSPSTVCNSLGYKTALPAKMAGRPRVVSIKRKSRAVPTAKAKRQSSIRRFAAKLGAKAARREVAVYKPSEATVDEQQETETQSTATESSVGVRRSRRLLKQQRGKPPSGCKESLALKAPQRRRSPPKAPELPKNATGDAITGPPGSNKMADAARDGPRKVNPQEAASHPSVTMADWEIAPGRIHVCIGDELENIAFSSSYLSQGRAVPVTDGAAFQVVEIQPGASVLWAADESRTRLCSVSRGAVHVNLPDKEFPIGPNGVWKVKQGMECAVVNALHCGAVVHVTIMREED